MKFILLILISHLLTYLLKIIDIYLLNTDHNATQCFKMSWTLQGHWLSQPFGTSLHHYIYLKKWTPSNKRRAAPCHQRPLVSGNLESCVHFQIPAKTKCPYSPAPLCPYPWLFQPWLTAAHCLHCCLRQPFVPAVQTMVVTRTDTSVPSRCQNSKNVPLLQYQR